MRTNSALTVVLSLFPRCSTCGTHHTMSISSCLGHNNEYAEVPMPRVFSATCTDSGSLSGLPCRAVVSTHMAVETRRPSGKKRTWCRSVRYGQTEGPHLHDASHLQSAYLHHWHHALHLNTFTSHASASPHVRLEPPGTGFGGFESTERPTASPWVTEPPSTRLTGTEPTRVAVREAARNGGAMAVATCDGVTRTSSGRESFWGFVLEHSACFRSLVGGFEALGGTKTEQNPGKQVKIGLVGCPRFIFDVKRASSLKPKKANKNLSKGIKTTELNKRKYL